MQDGTGVDREYLIAALEGKVAASVVREARLEAAVQQLLVETARLEALLKEAGKEDDE